LAKFVPQRLQNCQAIAPMGLSSDEQCEKAGRTSLSRATLIVNKAGRFRTLGSFYAHPLTERHGSLAKFMAQN
jgi:hypothetical protein